MEASHAISGCETVIAIPTFRRPQQLAALLDSLLPELLAVPALVVVADNDCGTEVPRVVEAFRSRWPLAVCFGVVARGVAVVRNELVRQSGLLAPDWQWLVMLDDNCLATPGWLSQLLATGNEFAAHVVGGPAQGVLPPGASRWARNSIFAARRPWPSGLVPTLNGTHNIAIARKILALVDAPLFRDEYGASGGEDYEFFRRVVRAQGRLAWCQHALVMKSTPAERLTLRALLYRYASTGAYMVRIDRSYDSIHQVWLRACKGMAGSIARLLLATLTVQLDKAIQSTLSATHYAGRLAGLFGAKAQRYSYESRAAK